MFPLPQLLMFVVVVDFVVHSGPTPRLCGGLLHASTLPDATARFHLKQTHFLRPKALPLPSALLPALDPAPSTASTMPTNS